MQSPCSLRRWLSSRLPSSEVSPKLPPWPVSPPGFSSVNVLQAEMGSEGPISACVSRAARSSTNSIGSEKLASDLFAHLNRLCWPTTASASGKNASILTILLLVVELGGFEPPAFSLRTRRATNCAIAPKHHQCYYEGVAASQSGTNSLADLHYGKRIPGLLIANEMSVRLFQTKEDFGFLIKICRPNGRLRWESFISPGLLARSGSRSPSLSRL